MLFEHLCRRELSSFLRRASGRQTVQETILYQTVYIHLLNHSDIRTADGSLFFRKDCLGIYCLAYIPSH